MSKSDREIIINRIEAELLLKLLDYVLPFVDKKINKKARTPSNLESIVNNSKPKISFEDIRDLEAALLANLNKNTQVSRNSGIKPRNIFYSLNLSRRKENNKSNNYSVAIKYEENSNEDKLKISVKDGKKEIYSAEIINNKEIKDKVAPYRFSINYEDKYDEERLSITYRQQLGKYMKKHIESKEDMSNMVPLKWVNILPESLMGGVLGFTYIGDHSMGRRADLVGKTARMVDIHESIHTPDEYETRRLTLWIMSKERSRYIK